MFAYTYYHKPPLRIEKLEPNLYLSFVFQSAGQRDPEYLREWRRGFGVAFAPGMKRDAKPRTQ